MSSKSREYNIEVVWIIMVRGAPRNVFESKSDAWDYILTDFWRTKEIAKKAGWDVVRYIKAKDS